MCGVGKRKWCMFLFCCYQRMSKGRDASVELTQEESRVWDHHGKQAGLCVCVCSFPLTWKALLMLDPQALEEKHREIMKHVKSAWTATTVTLHQFPATSSGKHSKLERTSLNAGVYSSSVLVSEDMCVICLQLITLVWMFGSTIWKRCSVTKLSLSYMYEDQDDYMNVSQWTSHWNLTPVLKLINIISYLIN